MRINRNDVEKLAGVASVSNLYPARYYTLGPIAQADPELATAIQMTGADAAQAAGFTGEGVEVAVMDTGIDVDHPDLGGDGIVNTPAETGDSFPNSRVIKGCDFVGDATTPIRRARRTTRFPPRIRTLTTATGTARTSLESSAPTRRPAPTARSASRRRSSSAPTACSAATAP